MTTTSLDDVTSVLLTRAHMGSRVAFSDLISRVEDRILSMARKGLGRSVRGQVESRDILQDVLAETVKRFPGCDFRDDAAFWAWIKRVTGNKIRDLARRVPLESAAGAGWRSRGAEGSRRVSETPSRSLIRRESVDRLESALKKLPRRQELAIRLRDIEGLPYDQIASQLGLRTAVSARVLRQRGWVALTRSLEGLVHDGWGDE